MPATLPVPTTHEWTAAELRSLLPAKRDAILAKAAEHAAGEYLNNQELTAFDAFEEKDLHAHSSNTESR